jgi:hypothetical protein
MQQLKVILEEMKVEFLHMMAVVAAEQEVLDLMVLGELAVLVVMDLQSL